MASRLGLVGKIAAGGALSLAFLATGCAHRYYDPYYNDYHTWNSGERVYYNQWVTENHMDPHRDYRHLSKEDQKRYWDWRHQHDHDRDHDRDHR